MGDTEHLTPASFDSARFLSTLLVDAEDVGAGAGTYLPYLVSPPAMLELRFCWASMARRFRRRAVDKFKPYRQQE